MRTRQHYSEADLIGQFKTHVWGIIEQNSGAIFHAARYLLDKIDACQSSFLKQIGLDDASAFLNFNFAPPSLRRDIGILGMFHKRVLGLAHPMFEKLLPFHRDEMHGASTGNHSKQLYGHILFSLRTHCTQIIVSQHMQTTDYTENIKYDNFIRTILKMACN